MAFSPERLAEGQAIRDLQAIPILVGGLDAEAGEACAAFWRDAVPSVQVMTLSSPEAAEMVKLADNLWIDLNIALANELAKLADALPFPIDVMEVIGGANSLKKGQHYVNILYPANGVGGYCLTKHVVVVELIIIAQVTTHLRKDKVVCIRYLHMALLAGFAGFGIAVRAVQPLTVGVVNYRSAGHFSYPHDPPKDAVVAGCAEFTFGFQWQVAYPAVDIHQRTKEYLLPIFGTEQLHRKDPRHIRFGQVGVRVNDYITNLMAKIAGDSFCAISTQANWQRIFGNHPIRSLDRQAGMAARPAAVVLIGNF